MVVAIVTIMLDNLACFLRDVSAVVPDWAGAVKEEQRAVADNKTNFVRQLSGDLQALRSLYCFGSQHFSSGPLRLSFAGILHFFLLLHSYLLNKMTELIQKTKPVSLSFLWPLSPIYNLTNILTVPISSGISPLHVPTAERLVISISSYIQTSTQDQCQRVACTPTSQYQFYLSGFCELHQIGAIDQPDKEAKCNTQGYNNLETWISYTDIALIRVMC